MYLTSRRRPAQEREKLHLTYKLDRNNFDKALRQAERRYNNEKLFDIETLACNNPRKFWETIRKLGPRKDNALITAVEIDEVLIYDVDIIRNKWFQDYKQLYIGPERQVDIILKFFLIKLINYHSL